MDYDNEKVRNITDEMRKRVDYGDGVKLNLDGRAVVEFCDRIDAANEREGDEAELKWSRIGHDEAVAEFKHSNAAAMRKALEKIVRIAEEWDTPGIHAVQVTLYRILEAARAALAAPARNCDVGTAEEQDERFDAFCARYYGTNDMSGDNCRICPLSPMECKFAWAQMPYEKEGGRGVK